MHSLGSLLYSINHNEYPSESNSFQKLAKEAFLSLESIISFLNFSRSNFDGGKESNELFSICLRLNLLISNILGTYGSSFFITGLGSSFFAFSFLSFLLF